MMRSFRYKLLILFLFFILCSQQLILSYHTTEMDFREEEQFFLNDFKTGDQSDFFQHGYEYGKKIGRIHCDLFDSLFTFLSVDQQSTSSFHPEKNEYVSQLIISLNKYCPYFFFELKGLSDSLNISLEQIILFQIDLSRIMKGECTTTLSTGSATRYDETFLTQNFDVFSTSPLLPVIRLFFTKEYNIHTDDFTYDYAFLGIPILYEIPLLNEKGLGFGGNALELTSDPNRYIDEGEGIPTYVLERMTMMSCSSVEEVAILWEESPRASCTHSRWPYHWDFSTSVWCDSDNGIVAIEQTHNNIAIKFSDSSHETSSFNGIICHANHHQWLDANKTGALFASENLDSRLRLDRAKEILESNRGSITLETCKDLTRDHKGGTDPSGPDSCDICRHPDENGSVVSSFAWIIEPQKYTVHWTRGSPCTRFRGKFRSFDFSLVFDKKSPNTSVVVNGSVGSDEWYTSPVKITFYSIDEMSGVDAVYYKVNDQRWKAYDEPIEIINDGKYLVQYYAVDRAGNKESMHTSSVKLDQSTPLLLVLTMRSAPFTIRCKAFVFDRMSLVSKVEFYNDDILKATISSRPFSWTYFGIEEIDSIKVIAYDHAGNQLTKFPLSYNSMS